MKITMICIGSMGDVRPYVVLGSELKRRGHEISICTFSNFKNVVEEEGLIYKPMSGNANTFISNVMKPSARGAGFLVQLRKTMYDIVEPFLHDLETAAEGADAIIGTFFGQVYRTIAEARHIPYIQTHYYPMDSNADTPIPVGNSISSIKSWNRASYQLGYLLISMMERHYMADWRDNHGLKPRKIAAKPDYILDGHVIPVLYAISPYVMPRPEAWEGNIHLTGSWLGELKNENAPSPELAAFVENGEPPVYIGFGSMYGNNIAKTIRAARNAVRSSGVRAVISTGSNKVDIKSEHNLCVVNNAPHGWLFERVSAVVHHGGAGTTFTGFKAGKPTLIVPFGGDQFFWGERAYALGVGPKPIPRETLTATKLSRALKKLVNTPSYAEEALKLSKNLKNEHGEVAAADIIERELSNWIGHDIRVNGAAQEKGKIINE